MLYLIIIQKEYEENKKDNKEDLKNRGASVNIIMRQKYIASIRWLHRGILKHRHNWVHKRIDKIPEYKKADKTALEIIQYFIHQ